MLSGNTRWAVLASGLLAAAALVLGISASASSAAWPTCLGEPATTVGTEGNDQIAGTSGDDVIVGLGGDDQIRGNGGFDLICGGDGNDALIATAGGESYFDIAVMSGDAGDDHIQGGSDVIVDADYEESPEPVNVNLDTGIESGWGNDTLVRVDFVDGSQYNDVLTGSAASDGLYGGPGDDTVAGLRGADYLSGGAGANSIDGGPGRDWLDYWNAPTGVHVSLAHGTATGWGTDTFRSIELVNGSKHADTLVGGPGADRLEGDAGNDRLYGGRGKDTLTGGKGKDRADGGPARDVCRAEQKVRCP